MNNKKVRTLTGTAMLTAVGVALQYIEISIPIIPNFIKLDFSDLPELIGAFAYGPVSAEKPNTYGSQPKRFCG